ncbi:alpha/beta fold hydrolase [Dongia deserti]|uniref:alpha/beta fold hydrolase n=1 Tax=Dongia deserti TaxID=2268030 RepID=UPI000E65B011|nr:alpha/beta fold hydrolase [Dongia deserti]
MPSEPIRFRHALRDGETGATTGLRAGQGQPVILVHGVGMSAEIWRPQIEALSQRYDVVAYDMLGHGGSDLPPRDARLSDYADQLLAVLDGLGIACAHLVGHSMGALVVLEFALSHPDRILSIAALNAVYCRSAEQRSAVETRAAVLEKGGHLETIDGTIARWFGDPVPERMAAAAATTRRLLSAVDPRGYQRTYRLFATADGAHRGRLTQLRAPSLFMTGDGDPNSTLEMSRIMASEAQNGRCEVLSGERHMMSLTAPEEVNKRLLGFLASTSEIDSRSLRRALGAFATGVTVVATKQRDGGPRGFTANSFTSVSLDPPLVLVCIAKSASSYVVFSEADSFAISVLAEHQRDTSGLFASKAADKFERASWHVSGNGNPVISGATAWFDCRKHSLVDAGDHAILIGRVVDFGDTPANPLGYCRGAYVTFGLSQAALAAARPRVGAILESEDGILFLADGDRFDLPEGISLEPGSDPSSLNGTLRRLGVSAQLGFLFAVFEDPRSGAGSVSVYYRGALTPPMPQAAGLRVIPLDQIPWAGLRDDAIRSMLRRYVHERTEDTFGVYIGDAERGTVQALAKQA